MAATCHRPRHISTTLGRSLWNDLRNNCVIFKETKYCVPLMLLKYLQTIASKVHSLLVSLFSKSPALLCSARWCRILLTVRRWTRENKYDSRVTVSFKHIENLMFIMSLKTEEYKYLNSMFTDGNTNNIFSAIFHFDISFRLVLYLYSFFLDSLQ